MLPFSLLGWVFLLGVPLTALLIAEAARFALLRAPAMHLASLLGVSGDPVRQTRLWLGAYLIAMPTTEDEKLTSGARLIAEKEEGPDQILTLWREAKARIVMHQPGPSAMDQEAARKWLQSAAQRLEGGFSAELLPEGERLFAIVYASTKPPREKPPVFAEFDGESCGDVALAFVSCSPPSRVAPVWGFPRIERLLIAIRWACVSASVAVIGLTLLLLALGQMHPESAPSTLPITKNPVHPAPLPTATTLASAKVKEPLDAGTDQEAGLDASSDAFEDAATSAATAAAKATNDEPPEAPNKGTPKPTATAKATTTSPTEKKPLPTSSATNTGKP